MTGFAVIAEMANRLSLARKTTSTDALGGTPLYATRTISSTSANSNCRQYSAYFIFFHWLSVSTHVGPVLFSRH